MTERQKEITDAVVKIIAHKGIQRLTVKNIAKNMNFTEAALYRHFSSKKDILLAILARFEELSENYEDLHKKFTNPLKKIEHFIQHRFKKFKQFPELAKVMFSEEIFQHDPDLSKCVLQIMQKHKLQLETIIKQGQKTGDIRNDIDAQTIFRIVIGSSRLLITQWSLNNFSFDIEVEGLSLWQNLKQIITNTNS